MGHILREVPKSVLKRLEKGYDQPVLHMYKFFKVHIILFLVQYKVLYDVIKVPLYL